MDEKRSALYSDYTIDGVDQDLTPAQMLDACLADRSRMAFSPSMEPIVDETLDYAIRTLETDRNCMKQYLEKMRSVKEVRFPMAFPEEHTRWQIAHALINAIWKGGHFRLGDISLRPEWKWNGDKLGSMACFYSSVHAAAEYADMLGIKFSGYSYSDADACSMTVSAGLLDGDPVSEEEDVEDFFGELPFKTEHPKMSGRNLHPTKMQPDPQSWLIYVPFDTCDYRFGGSLLAQAMGVSGSTAPTLDDPDYFIDCYEVVRELVEDKIILAGTTVGRGGLISALKRMTAPKVGAGIELADLMKATGEKDIIRLLFAEVPGVIFQIADIDYDYVDAELLLQDVAFYPLGHPVTGSSRINVLASEKSGIQTILESIIRSQNSEGED